MVFDDEGHAVGTIVGRRHRVHGNIAKRKRITRRKKTDSIQLPQSLTFDRVHRLTRRVDRQFKFAGKHAHPAGVIAVIVRDKQGLGVADVATVRSQSLVGLLAADSSVKHQRNVARFDEKAIAVTS